MTRSPSSDPFVGRERELFELTAALDDVLEGRGRMVMLVGEPGIGKTRTAEELAAIAESRGNNVLWGRCPEERGAPPYWPWVQIIRAFIAGQDANEVRQALGSDAGVIAEVVAAISDVVPELEPPPALHDLDAARFRLFDAITSFLKRSSQDRPLLLVLDNLHWADGSSLRLLEFVAQELSDSRLLILGTYRDIDVTREHPLFDTLGDLTRQRLFSRVLLRGLSPDEVGQVIESAGGAVPPSDLIGSVHTQTEGNPLFVGEIVRFLVQEGLLGQGGPASADLLEVRLPEGIREVIGRRLNRLSGNANDVLTTAAIIGSDFTLAQLSAIITETTQDVLIETLDEAVSAKVIDESPNELGRFAFTHALIQQTLRDGLTLTNQVRVHARIAEALEEYYGDEAEDHAAELALHFAEAEMALGPERVVRYSLIAADRAFAEYAHEDAEVNYLRALTASGGEVTDDVSALACTGLGKVQIAQSKGEGWNHLRAAFRYYEENGDVTRAVAIPKGFVSGQGGGFGVYPVDLVELALKIVDEDTLDHGDLLVRWARVKGTEEERLNRLDKATQIARRFGDQGLQARALTTIAYVNGWTGHMSEVYEPAMEAVKLSRTVGDRHNEALALIWAGNGALEMGDVEEAARLAGEAMALAERLRDRWWLSSAAISAAKLHLAAGRFNEAVQAVHNGISISFQDSRLLGIKAITLFEMGDTESADSILKEHSDLGIFPYFVAAYIYRSERRIADFLGRSRDLKSHEILELTDWIHDASNLFFSGTADECRRAAAILDQRTGTMPGWPISSVHLSALLMWRAGDLSEAADRMDRAGDYYRGAGFGPGLAWCSSDYAELLIDRTSTGSAQAQPGDREKAAALRDEAIGIAVELGMIPLEKRLLELRDKAESMSAQATANPDGLTNREVEVLRLVATGRSNREIGDDLLISENTVKRHVSNIFSKVGASNRMEAANYANRHGLAGDGSA